MAQLFLLRLCLFAMSASTGLCRLRPWVEMTSQVLTGGSVVMKCNYDLKDGQELDKLAFTHDFTEFYRYQPKNNPQITTQDHNGVKVNKEKSSTTSVQLENLSLDSSGEYRCEVVVNNPYDYESAETKLTVIDPPESDPEITGGQSKYKIGDKVSVNCTSKPSNPRVFMQWYINDMDWPSTDVDNESDDVINKLEFTVQQHHFRNGDLKLRCNVNIGFAYKKTLEIAASKDE